MGNPETNNYFDNKGILEYAWSHAVISDQDYNEAKRVCNFKNDDWSPECNKVMTVLFNRYKEIDIYNIYAPSCLLNKTSSVADDFVSRKDLTYAIRCKNSSNGSFYFHNFYAEVPAY